MSRSSHYCQYCGWTSGITDVGGYYTCPSCGKSHGVISTCIDSGYLTLYNLRCPRCGWESGPTSQGGTNTCPNCGNHQGISSTKLSSPSSGSSSSDVSSNSGSGTQTSGEKSDSDSWVFIAILVGAVLAFFPGLLVTMLFGTGTLWSWIWGVLISLALFACCGGDWKKYLVLDVIILAICGLLAWLIDSFTPFTYVFREIGPFY